MIDGLTMNPSWMDWSCRPLPPWPSPPTHNQKDTAKVAADCGGVTRRSDVLEYVASHWAQVVVGAIFHEENDHQFDATTRFSKQILQRTPTNSKVSDESTMNACYLKQFLPGLVDMTAKYLSPKNNHNDNNNKSGKDSWPMPMWVGRLRICHGSDTGSSSRIEEIATAIDPRVVSTTRVGARN
jgi:hypothetical protein